ncbi:MAG: Fe-only nitrogenase accessory protein AnfO [Geobacteraceae bacterium]|nr:Fe-only nitrogenase accessory protein AnfO [Geobacteraceae bacterium]
MKIATFINTRGDVAGFHENGHICLYEKLSGVWTKAQEIHLEMNMDMSLSGMKNSLTIAVSQLDECEVFIVSELKGLMHALLVEEMGFRTWKSQGTVVEQLDNVFRHEKDFAAKKENPAIAAEEQPYGSVARQKSCGGGSSMPGKQSVPQGRIYSESGGQIPKPLPVGNIRDGHYRINLAEVLNNDPRLNSKQVLVPFMEETPFLKLEILCDHPPRWFSTELKNLNLMAEFETHDTSGRWLKLVIVPKTC